MKKGHFNVERDVFVSICTVGGEQLNPHHRKRPDANFQLNRRTLILGRNGRLGPISRILAGPCDLRNASVYDLLNRPGRATPLLLV